MPAWVEDDDIWEKAKKEVSRDKYTDDDSYYAVVTTVYKNMGGKIKNKKSSSKYDTISKIAISSPNIPTDILNKHNALIDEIYQYVNPKNIEVWRKLHILYDSGYWAGVNFGRKPKK